MLHRWVKIVGIASISLIVMLLLTGYLYQFIGTKIDDYKYPPPGKMVNVGGYQLHINCTGEGGPTVVLDAGMASSSLDWALVQPEIAKFTRDAAMIALAWDGVKKALILAQVCIS